MRGLASRELAPELVLYLALLQCMKDFVEHSVNIGQHVVVVEAKNKVAHRAEGFCSSLISYSPTVMRRTIDLDDQLGLNAQKIHNVPVERSLPAKLEPSKPPAAEV